MNEYHKKQTNMNKTNTNKHKNNSSSSMTSGPRLPMSVVDLSTPGRRYSTNTKLQMDLLERKRKQEQLEKGKNNNWEKTKT